MYEAEEVALEIFLHFATLQNNYHINQQLKHISHAKFPRPLHAVTVQIVIIAKKYDKIIHVTDNRLYGIDKDHTEREQQQHQLHVDIAKPLSLDHPHEIKRQQDHC